MKCAICGQDIINENISRDHVFPRAIYKWQETLLSPEAFKELKSSVESSYNIVKTHANCNYFKEDTLPDIDNLFLSQKRSQMLHEKAAIIQPYISGYLNIKESITKRQNGCCFICHKPLNEVRVLRRIDSSKPRTIENGCILCHGCNIENPKIHSKFV